MKNWLQYSVICYNYQDFIHTFNNNNWIIYYIQFQNYTEMQYDQVLPIDAIDSFTCVIDHFHIVNFKKQYVYHNTYTSNSGLLKQISIHMMFFTWYNIFSWYIKWSIIFKVCKWRCMQLLYLSCCLVSNDKWADRLMTLSIQICGTL